MKVVANKIQTGFALALLVLILFGIAAWYTTSRNLKLFHQVERSEQFGTHLENTLVQLLNMETGVRGFIITGDEQFLAPYRAGRAEISNSLANAKQRARKDPQLQRQLTHLDTLIQQKLAFMEQSVQLRRNGNPAKATQSIASGQGKQIMDQIRTVITSLENNENAILEQQLDRSEAQARRTIYIIIISGLVAVIAVAASGIMVQRDFRQRRKAEAALEIQSERLALATRAGNIGVWDWNIDTGEVFWDDSLYALCGRRRDQFSPSYDRFISILHPDDRQRVEHDLQLAVRGEKEYAAEFRVLWPDQSVHYLQANSMINRDASGKAVRMLGTNWDVTQRKLEETKFRGLLEAAPDGMIITTPDGKMTIVNAQAEKLFGYSRAELIGKPVEILVPQNLRSGHPDHRRDFISNGHSAPMGVGRTLSALRKDGTEFPIEITLSPLETETGPLVIAAIRDITQRVRIEQALRDSAQQQQQLAEHLELERARLAEAQAVAKVGSWELDLRTHRLTWSDENYRIFGKDPITFDATYEAFLELLYPEDRAAVHKAYTESVASHQPYAIDHRIQLSDGTINYVHERGQTFYDQQGRPIRSVGTTQDITARKQAEEALRHSEETLRSMSESMPQMAWMCRPDGWNIYFNQQWVDYTGLSLEESSGHGWNIPFHPEDKERAWGAWKKATETGGRYDLECRLRRADGVYRWFLIRGVPVRNKEGVILNWFGTCTDIDDMKRAEEQISQLNAQLEQHSATLEQQVSERTAALRDSIRSLETLTYTMAHDLRAPVRAMTAYTEALLEDVPLNETGKTYATQIRQNADRMNHLISDLLDYGQLSHLEFPTEPIDLKTQIDKLLVQFEPDLRTTKAQVQVQASVPAILANERLLSQVLANLFSNALKFVPPGVVPRIRFRAETRGSVVRLWVEDNGIGIASQYHQKIFGVFHRLHATEQYPGTGVGLAVAKRAIDLMKGQLGLESDPGKGSRFWFELPLAENQARRNYLTDSRPKLTIE